ncbi:lipopolysaccharide biosynthesis protein [Facklamia sp. P13064]|uniref:lipopolysaccharide biosynthesis protein n=1 Tax=Facklamia sp. P13064 TaxID=3421953 RepID=UPI003D186841
MNNYKKLINNFFIFSLGNLGSKLISFLLVPLFTYYLSQQQYGMIDIVVTSSSLLIPIVSGCTHEAIVRFVINNKSNNQKILFNSIFISFIGYMILVFFYPIFSRYNFLDSSLKYMYLLIFVQILNQIFSQYIRAIGKVKLYAINGVMITLFIGVLNVIFIVYYGLGVEGYFTSTILAYIMSTVFLVFKSNLVLNKINITIDKNTIIMILSFSLPLIFNSLMWWVSNSSSKFLINFYLGLTANGLFAVSTKIPTIIVIINNIFTQAWQLSAFEEYENNKSSNYYARVFEYYSSFLFIASSSIILIIKPIFYYVFSESFFASWEPVPFLILGSLFSSFSAYVGVNYTASKNTIGIFKTSVFGGMVSLISNLIFIPLFGIVGAGISSFLSFLIMFMVRIYDTKKIINLEINYFRFYFQLVLVLIQILIMFINTENDFFINLIILIILNLNLRHLYLEIYSKIKKIISNLRRN